jgi:hypothetical protein
MSKNPYFPYIKIEDGLRKSVYSLRAGKTPYTSALSATFSDLEGSRLTANDPD